MGTETKKNNLIAVVEGEIIVKLDDKTSTLKPFKTAFRLTAEQAQEPTAFIKRNKLIEKYLQTKGIVFAAIYKRNLIALFNEEDPLSSVGINPRWLGQAQILKFFSSIGIDVDPNLHIALMDLRTLVIEYARNPFDKSGFHALLEKYKIATLATDEIVQSAILSSNEEDDLLKQFDTAVADTGIKTYSNDDTPKTKLKVNSKSKPVNVKPVNIKPVNVADEELDKLL